MKTPIWRYLLDQALRSAVNTNTASYVQLATVDHDGAAQVRTMVWRGFNHDNNQFLMATDSRSDKIAQLASNNKAQLVWYMVDAREQFRFSGRLHEVNYTTDGQGPRREVWSKMSVRARESFFSNYDGSIDKDAHELAKQDEPSKNFTVLVLSFNEVDHLSVHTEPNQRYKYVLSETGWSKSRLFL